jgi:hypothetical protein
MSIGKNYLNNRFRNYAGRHASGAKQLANATGFAAGGDGGNMFNGAAQYILQVSNASAAAVTNFDVLGAAQYLFGNYGGGTWDNAGNFTLNGVTISSVFTQVSYQQILSATTTQPFTVGAIYLQSTAGSASQVTDIFTLTSQAPGGQLYSEPIAPILNPMQFQTSVTYSDTSFNVTSLTKLTWNQIYASSVFQIRLYPAQVIDPAQSLNNNAVKQNFTRPVASQMNYGRM